MPRFCLVQKLFHICSKVTASVRAAGGKEVAVFVAAWAAVSFLVLPPNFDSRVVETLKHDSGKWRISPAFL